MGTVYRATDTTMARAVAIKLIEPDPTAEDDAVSRFLREARNTARITHPHIVHLYDLGRGDDGELFFVMELLGGESLSERIRRAPPLSVDDTIHIARQICAALGYAHKKGLVHRDLKPGNIMITPRNGDPQFVKVLDFGVAKAQDQGTQITKTGALVGTVDYMAPEQILSRKVDARTDVYSLGVILYRMLTGTPLFPEGAMPLVIKHHVSSTPEPLRSRAPELSLSPGLERVVMQCLAKKPEERYATMEELDFALVQAAREPREPLGLRPPEPGEFDDLSQMATVRRDSPISDSVPRPQLPAQAPNSETKLAIPRASSPSRAEIERRSEPSRSSERRSEPLRAEVERRSEPSRSSVPSGEARRASGDLRASRPDERRAPSGDLRASRTNEDPRARTLPLVQRPPAMDVQHLGAPETPSEVHVGSASIARAGLKLEPPSTHSQLRWLGLLAPIPAAAYAVWQQGSVSSLVLLAVCLLVGAVLFFVSVGRPSR